jgi:hypothetical protein
VVDGLCESLAYLKPQTLMVYGDSAREWLEPLLPKSTRYHWIPSRLAVKEKLGLMNRPAKVA